MSPHDPNADADADAEGAPARGAAGAPGAGAVLFTARPESEGDRVAADGALIVLTESGVRLGVAPEIGWHELVFVSVVDAGSVLGRLAGRPRQPRLELGVTDAASVRRRLAGAGLGSLVRFGGRTSAGVRLGLVRFPIDPGFSGRTRRRLMRVLFEQAESRALPQGWFESRRQAAAWRRGYLGAGTGAAGTLPFTD